MTRNGRCTANSRDLEQHAGRRMEELAEQCRRAFDEKALWDDYGIVGDAMVSATRKINVKNVPDFNCHIAFHSWLSSH